MRVKVNKWLDLLDRVGWTALQASGAAAFVFLTNGANFSWQAFLSFVGAAAGLAAIKVVIGQRTSDGTGSLVGQVVVEADPST